MIVRLIQLLVYNNSSWKQFNDTFKLLPGPLLEISQAEYPEDFEKAVEMSTKYGSESSNSSMLPSTLINYTGIGTTPSTTEQSIANQMLQRKEVFPEKKVILVFVIGGLSFMEIAAFRFLSKDPTFPYKIVVATTNLVSGSSFISNLAAK